MTTGPSTPARRRPAPRFLELWQIRFPIGAIASTLFPSIQFSNFSGIDSTLSGARIDGFTTFSSRGTAVHTTVSVGYFVRF